MSSHRIVLLAATVVACHPTVAPAPVVQSGAYVILLGNDTLAVDQYTRTGNRIEGTVVQRAPRTLVTRYTVMLADNGMPLSLEQTTRLPDGSVPPNAARSASITFTLDSAVSRIQRDTLATIPIAARAAFPLVGNAYSLYALPIAAMRLTGRDSASYNIMSAGSRNPTPLTVVKTGENRYLVYLATFPFEFTTDAAGQILTVDGARTTQHVISRRQEPLDVAALATSFASREQQTRAMGMLSPRDTVRATVGGADLLIDYSRPLLRGRRVFGANGVLGDSIWRTGANAATQFRISAPITVAGKTVPAGTYTLWTLAIPGRYQLIVNRRTGQWGTEYNAEQDLVRVPLTASSLDAPVDRFTIVIEPAAGATNAGTLRLRWDTTELSVPFTSP